MAENKIIIDKITTLRLLHDVRVNMQKYALSQKTPKIRQTLIEGYLAFADNEKISSLVRNLIASYVAKITFNPYAFKTTSQEEDKKLQQSAEQNKASEKLQKKIAEELSYMQKRGKMLDVPSDAVFENISANEQYFIVKIAGRDEPIQFPVKTYKGKHLSLLGVKAISDKTYAKKGFDEKTFKFLLAFEDKGFSLNTAGGTKNVGKKYYSSQYKSLLGLSAKDVLSGEQEKELEILNSLTEKDQRNFLIGVKQRKMQQAYHKEFFDALNQEKNLLKLLADEEKLRALFVKNGMKDYALDIQDDFICSQIKTDKKGLWNYFSKTENSRYAYYDILMTNLIVENKSVFKEIFDFTSPQEMNNNIIAAYQKVKKFSSPMLPDALCAEILAQGIFQNAVVTSNTNADKINKMNLLLNEFGLNIKFDTIKVTKVPDMSIETAQQQNLLDRDAFEADKKTPFAQMQERQFKKQLHSLGIDHPDNASTHHFLALKYNPFIDMELNQSSNYVKTARQHPWNLDGHQFVHAYDTAGEFLIADEKQEFKLMDFNSLRKAFNWGKNLTLYVPILQVRNEYNEFSNILSPAQKNGEYGIYISTDKTPSSFIHLPQCCKGLFISKDKSKDIFEKE